MAQTHSPIAHLPAHPRPAVGDVPLEWYKDAPFPTPPHHPPMHLQRPSFAPAVGDVPLEWYKDEEHIGYDVEGNKLERRPRKDKLDRLLARNDGKVRFYHTIG